ncbi:TolC family outer membrane protein [Dokdonella sp.]|uniref:TolC family outer membrane protein n=1 Tax=Dokdonella sp. TaxID=2291710 RepID=UPI001B04A32D|nr:TolC family outer membrane protein [Dokdonella sp.]MBO9664319.1 TolC family outer membrane protein [Dokdonella sp.]
MSSLSLALLLAFGASAAQADDLIQVYQEARVSDPTLAGAEATKLATDEGVDQARSFLLPQLGANIDYTRSRGGNDADGVLKQEALDGTPLPPLAYTSTTVTNHTRTYGASLNQSILDISKWTALKSSKYTAEAGEATYSAAQQQLMIDTAQTYFNVLTSIDALKFANANEKALARQLEQAQQRFEVGLAAITDVNDAKAQHDQAVASVISNQNAVDTAREAVRRLTNKEPGEFKKLRENLPLDHPTPDDPAAWVDVALKQNPSLASSSLQVDAANTNINTARAGHLPTITGQLGYSKSSQWGDTRYGGIGRSFHDGAGEPKWGPSVTFSLNVPIFSGGYTQSRVRQAIHQRDFAQDQFEFNRRLVEANTRNSYRSVIAGASQVEATKAAVVSAQSSVDATQAGYEVGTRTIVDVLISQQTLLNAQSQYSAARHAFVVNGLLLKQAAGVVELKDLEAVNALLE